jgi:hypothetical protein
VCATNALEMYINDSQKTDIFSYPELLFDPFSSNFKTQLELLNIALMHFSSKFSDNIIRNSKPISWKLLVRCRSELTV